MLAAAKVPVTYPPFLELMLNLKAEKRGAEFGRDECVYLWYYAGLLNYGIKVGTGSSCEGDGTAVTRQGIA